MSLFSRTASDIDKLEAAIKSLALDTNGSAESRKQNLTSIQQDLSTIQPNVSKFVSKADAGEVDPNKRIYGAAMVAKVRALATRLSTLESQLEEIAPSIDEAYDKFLKSEQERNAKEEADRIKREQEEAAAKAKAQAEVEAAAKAEEERRRQEIEKAEEERRRKADEEEKHKQERLRKEEEERQRKEKEAQEEAKRLKEQQEQEDQLRKKEEDRARKQRELAKVAAASNGDPNAVKGISLTIKTTRGKKLELSNIPPTSTALQVKQAIERQHSIPVPAQRLIYQGHLLADNRTIDTYNITEGASVHIVENARAMKTESAGASSASAPGSASTPAPAPIVPPGTVLELQNGRTQFQSVLDNCSSSRLVVVDWSASWCGPCKMIAPVFKRLATRYPDVTFVKVDTEASMDNSSLAQEVGIAAYPTFHYYIRKSMVHSQAGARATDLENNIKKYRAQVINSQPGAASSSGASPTKNGALTKAVVEALGNLKKNCNQNEFIVAVQTLIKYVRNIVNHPGESKYLRVNTANKNFQDKLASKIGGMQCMYAFGFKDVRENGDAYLVLSEEASHNPELATIKTQLEQVLPASDGASSSGTGATRTGQQANRGMPGLADLNPGAFNAMAGAGGLFPGGAPEQYQQMMQEMAADPSFAQVLNEITQNPTAMTRIMEMEQAIANGDFAAVQRLQNDPSITQLQNTINQNPGFLNSIRRLQNQNGANPGAFGGFGQAFGGMGGTPGGNTTQPGTNTNTQNTPSQASPPTYPGAPTTAEEEERLLQEAIRLSMQDTNTQPDQNNNQDKNDQENSES